MLTYLCPKVSTPPIIDGSLDDNAWNAAPVVHFVDAVTGNATSRSTTARLCWDETYLHVAFECFDDEIRNSYTHRDDPIFLEDVVEVFLDPDCDETSYFEIDISPSNVVFDADIDPNNGKPISSPIPRMWDCVGLKTAVQIDVNASKWTVEMAVPFSSIGRDVPVAGEKWRANLYRIDAFPQPAEYLAWSPTFVDPAGFHIPKMFGIIMFTDEIGLNIDCLRDYN